MKLVIAEKPSVANSIADVLGANNKSDGYRSGNGYIVSWCVGHLIELTDPAGYGECYEKWNYDTLPILPNPFTYVVKHDTQKQYNILKKLMTDDSVTSLVCATDAGREGELIFRLVYEKSGSVKPFERLWISSMEESAIREGFANLKPGKDYDSLYASALARQRADWLVGINGTRLFTTLYNKLLKVGRVQTPTLAMLVDRQAEIMGFTKQAYYQAHILCNGEYRIDAVTDRIDKKDEADNVAAVCIGKEATVTSVTRENKKVSPPKLYDLTTLQRDANRLFGMTAKQTLEATQSLYEKKLVTYPRTDSQYLSDDMEDTARSVADAITKTIFKDMDIMFNPNIKPLLNSKKVSDHHAIIPTVEIVKSPIEELPENEKRVLSLCSNRLMCATAGVHIYDFMRAELSCSGTVFKVSGKEVVANGWKDFDEFFRHTYKAEAEKEDKDTKLPELTEGLNLAVAETKVTEHFTKPPKNYTEDSLLAAMERAGAAEMDTDVERKGLGTPATRADIIEKLVKDGYAMRDGKKLIPTDDGIKLITILPDTVKSPQLTADWENQLALVSKGEVSADVFMSGITQMVKDLVETYSSVSDEEKSVFANKKELLGKCPKCGADVISGKYGAYCEKKCGMNVKYAMGNALSDEQVKKLLSGKKILVRGIKSIKKEVSYDAYLTAVGVDEYSYKDKDGNCRCGYRYKFDMEFPKKK